MSDTNSHTDAGNALSRAFHTIVNEKEFAFLALIAVLGALAPHPANVSPIAALGLFAGTYMHSRVFLLVPLAAVFIADMTSTGFYNLLVMGFVYLGFLLSSLTGRWLCRGATVLRRAPFAVLLMSVGFYLVSNIGNWLAFYPLTLASLLECYATGLPYFFRTLFGNALYSALFIGGFEFIAWWQQRHAPRVMV